MAINTHRVFIVKIAIKSKWLSGSYNILTLHFLVQKFFAVINKNPQNTNNISLAKNLVHGGILFGEKTSNAFFSKKGDESSLY